MTLYQTDFLVLILRRFTIENRNFRCEEIEVHYGKAKETSL